jgi:uncharacterized lipoprotein YddW (UPF0748 family)
MYASGMTAATRVMSVVAKNPIDGVSFDDVTQRIWKKYPGF